MYRRASEDLDRLEKACNQAISETDTTTIIQTFEDIAVKIKREDSLAPVFQNPRSSKVKKFVPFVAIRGQVLSIADILNRQLTEDEIAQEFCSQRESPVFDEVILAILSLNIESVAIDPQSLEESRHLYENIMNFKRWITSCIQEGRLSDIETLIYRCNSVQSERLGLTVGPGLAELESPQRNPILMNMAKAATTVNPDEQGRKLIVFVMRACKSMLQADESIRPYDLSFQGEDTDIDIWHDIFTLLILGSDIEFEMAYKQIYDEIRNINRVMISSRDDLYLQRLGIDFIELKDSHVNQEFEDNLLVTIYFTNGHQISATLHRPSNRPENWEKEYAAAARTSEIRIMEIIIYLQAVLIDMNRLIQGTESRDPLDIRQIIKGRPSAVDLVERLTGTRPQVIGPDETFEDLVGTCFTPRTYADLDIVDRKNGMIGKADPVTGLNFGNPRELKLDTSFRKFYEFVAQISHLWAVEYILYRALNRKPQD